MARSIKNLRATEDQVVVDSQCILGAAEAGQVQELTGTQAVSLLPAATVSVDGKMTKEQAQVVSEITTDGAGNIGVGNPTIAARLHVKGSGATSATTAFKVDNSSNTELFKVRDDGRAIFSTDTSIHSGGMTLNYPSKSPLAGGIYFNRGSGAEPFFVWAKEGVDQSQMRGIASGMRWTDSNGTTEWIRIESGNFSVGTATSSARLHVKGSGATSATTAFKVDNSSNTESLSVRDDGLFSTSGSRIIKYDTFTADVTLTQSTKSCAVINPSGTGTVITMHLSPPDGIVQTTVNASAFAVTLGRNSQKMAGLEANYTLPAYTAIDWQYYGATIGWLPISISTW